MSYAGMHVSTGRRCAELDHLRQSIRDILTTPIGSRVMRRDYGSYLPELIDQPFNDATRQRLMGASVMALHRWEPRLRIERIAVGLGAAAGEVMVSIEGARSDGPRPARLDPLVVQIRGMR
ncbi:GPW/gp25 family protein [Thauera butanivorans]|uniref:GPW/gp25 family protein n=1 Tax=Thauera butanivorans TaxID=86174 RepID=UPI000839369C|nr:GPW/gp25 family protein [Thauera butanivorans]